MAANPAIARQWFLAQWLTRVRWAGIPLGLILLILFPADTLLGTIALVLALGLGNGGITLLLRRGLEPRRLRLVRASASVMGWGVGAGLLVLYNREPVSDSPALLLILILLTGLRYGLRGTIAAMAGAALGVGGFIGTQALILHVLAVDLARCARSSSGNCSSSS